MHTKQIPILIVGAGPAGLCSSILLSRLGVASLLVERHASTSNHPKATGISTRTMELFRAWGIEAAIREQAMTVEFVSSVRGTLSSPELERRSLGYPTPDEARAISPTHPAVLAQDHLEPILLNHARSYGCAEVRLNTELTTLHQDESGVHATIVDRATGVATEVHARYVIAADGARSRIRGLVGIAMKGVEQIGEYLSILFRADLSAYVGGRGCGLYILNALGGPAPSVLVPTSRDGRWILATPWRGSAQPVAGLPEDQLVAMVGRAIGRDDVAIDVLDRRLVAIGAEVAERFREGDVFLVGDAAHRTAPTGGTGMNTAIHAAHNLAWKLAAVLRGTADASLLDSYEPERRPSGERNLLRSRGMLQGISGVAADMGVVYASTAVVAAAEDRPAVVEPNVVCEGARAPHLWLTADGRDLSTLDLFGHGLVLLTGLAGGAWRLAGARAGLELGVPLGVITIGGAELHETSESWRAAYGIDADGAVLVRPDGHVAWRSTGAAADPSATLVAVLSRVLGSSRDSRAESAVGGSGEDRRCA